MPSHAPERAKLFTPEQANATLPLVRAIVSDMVKLAREVEERRQRLTLLMAGRHGASSNPLYNEELEQVEAELEKDHDQLRDYVRELQELGVEPKDPFVGLVDFPCLRDGRVVYLCWKLGEPRIDFWHEIEAGFAGRQPLEGVTGAVAENN
jgi:hypothetical protein